MQEGETEPAPLPKDDTLDVIVCHLLECYRILLWPVMNNWGDEKLEHIRCAQYTTTESLIMRVKQNEHTSRLA